VDLNLFGNELKKNISVFPTGAKWNIGNTGMADTVSRITEILSKFQRKYKVDP
jgi:hypothetical protein